MNEVLNELLINKNDLNVLILIIYLKSSHR